MKKDDIQFNLTEEMTDYIIEINELKNHLIELEEKITIADTEEEIKKIKIDLEETTKRIEKYKRSFIKSFQKSNQEQIKLYLKLEKD